MRLFGSEQHSRIRTFTDGRTANYGFVCTQTTGEGMAKLALAVKDETALAGDVPALRIDRRTGEAVYRSAGSAILLYRFVPSAVVQYLGTARVDWLGDWDGPNLTCRLADLELFLAPITRTEDVAMPGARRMILLENAHFGAIVEEGRSAEALAPGTPEDVFEALRVPRLRTLEAVSNEVLQRWDYCCAVTGRQFAAEPYPHKDLVLVHIRPRSARGAYHVRNLLPMIPLAAKAWEAGIVSVGPELDFITVPNQLDPDLFALMRKEGTLLLPADRPHWPDPANLRYHRDNIFGH
jgi:hypothetical protein